MFLVRTIAKIIMAYCSEKSEKKSYEILVSKPLLAREIFLKFASLPMNKNDFELNFALGGLQPLRNICSLLQAPR